VRNHLANHVAERFRVISASMENGAQQTICATRFCSLVRPTDLCFSCEGPFGAHQVARPRPRDLLAVYHSVAGPRGGDLSAKRPRAFVSCKH
jgi:hypothetical protein